MLGEYEHTMAQPESLDGYARIPDFFSRGIITAQRMSSLHGSIPHSAGRSSYPLYSKVQLRALQDDDVKIFFLKQ